MTVPPTTHTDWVTNYGSGSETGTYTGNKTIDGDLDVTGNITAPNRPTADPEVVGEEYTLNGVVMVSAGKV